MTDPREERVYWGETFHSEIFDFRSRITFVRFDGCTFVKCTILLDGETEQLAFTNCVFRDCNIDHLDGDDRRGVLSDGNIFDRPIEQRRLDFEKRLAAALEARRNKQK
jgi:hypothetical protein